MTEERLDLGALDPGRNPDRIGRIAGAVRAAIDDRPRGRAWLPSLVAAAVAGLLALAAIFLAGLFAGPAVARWRSADSDAAPEASGLARSLDALDLTPVQRERIERILSTSQGRTDQALAEVLPRLQAVVDSVDAEIGEVLTEERLRLREIRQTRIVNRRVIVGERHGEAADTLEP